jgi:hypothetical protein
MSVVHYIIGLLAKGNKMPNWCYNTLTIQGPKVEVDYIKDRLNTPFTLAQETYGMGDISSMGFPTKIKEVTYSNPVFAFFNIHSYKDEGITDEEYACQPNRGDIDIQNDPDWFRKSVEFAKTQKDWYSWNNSNWGTKWDVAVSDDDKYPNTELLEYKSEGDDNWVIYKYETAWSPAVTILTKLSNLVPNCLLTLEFEEETGWGGEYEIMKLAAMLASLLTALNTARMTAENSALNAMRVLGRMIRLWQNVRPIWYYCLSKPTHRRKH